MNRGWPSAIAAGVLASVVAFAALPLLFAAHAVRLDAFDVGIYRIYGEAIVDGALPYRDLGIEYPPGAVPFFVLPALVTGTEDSFLRVFAVTMGFAAVVALVVVARLGQLLVQRPGELVVRVVAAGVLVALLGSVALTRFDLAPALLTVVALAAIAMERFRTGAAVLGAAVAVKAWPVVVLPLAVVVAARTRGRREGAVVAGLCAAVVVLAYVSFAVVAPDGVWSSIVSQLQRSLQIETLGASLLAAAHTVGLLELTDAGTYYELESRAADAVGVATSVVQAAALVFVWVRFALGPVEPARLIRYASAAVAVSIAFGKVLSPQYLLWLVPLVVLVPGARGRTAIGLLGVAAGATALYYTNWWFRLIDDLDGAVVTIVLFRDLVLVALVCALLWPTATVRAPARSP